MPYLNLEFLKWVGLWASSVNKEKCVFWGKMSDYGCHSLATTGYKPMINKFWYIGCPKIIHRCLFWITDKLLKIIHFPFLSTNVALLGFFSNQIKHFWPLVISYSQRTFRWSFFFNYVEKLSVLEQTKKTHHKN